MSFDKMKVDELRAIANGFAVDIDPKDNKTVIVTKLGENGVTWDYYQRQLDTEGPVVEEKESSFDEPVETDESVQVVLKMTRDNGTFEVRGVRFTKANPYAIVAERDADFILEKYEGFRIASPKEVREFYR